MGLLPENMGRQIKIRAHLSEPGKIFSADHIDINCY